MTIYPTPSNPFIRCDGQQITPENIVWLEGDSNYTRIHQCNRSPRLAARTLKWYEPMLTNFIRIRRDAMVNPAHIRAIYRDENCPGKLKMLLSNDAVLTVARRRLQFVRSQIRSYYQAGRLVAVE